MCRAGGGAALPLAATSTLEWPAGLGGRTGRKGWKEGVGRLGGRAGSPPEPGHPCSPCEEARTCSQGCQRWSRHPPASMCNRQAQSIPAVPFLDQS